MMLSACFQQSPAMITSCYAIFPWASRRASADLAVGFSSGLNHLEPCVCLLRLSRSVALLGSLALVGHCADPRVPSTSTTVPPFPLRIRGIREMPLDWPPAQLGLRGARGARGPHKLCYAVVRPGLLNGRVGIFKWLPLVFSSFCVGTG